jgi:RNA polymerase sigma factor (sigma-70 family)
MQSYLLENLDEFVAFARKRLNDPELAADAVQDSLLKALQPKDDNSEVTNPRAWFYSILRRTIIDLYRRRDVRERTEARLVKELGDPATPEEERVACRCIERIIADLKPEYRELVRRADLEEESTEQVAKSLRITPNNLKVRLHRARRQLKEKLLVTCSICAKHGCLDCTCGSTCG